jgi:hypothetical protein
MPLELAKLQNVKTDADGWTCACPACRSINGGDASGNHLKIWKSTGRWSCIIAPSDKAHNQAIWALAGDGASNSDLSWITAEPELPPVEIDRTWPVTALNRLVKDHSYWAGRGVDEETVSFFQGGIAVDGQMANRYVIPIFNSDKSSIIGFTGRAMKKEMTVPWKHIGKTSKWVWGGLDEVEAEDRAILVESPGDLLSLRQAGFKEAICLFGINLSQCVLAHLIAANPATIIISTNNDIKHSVGQNAAEKIKNILDKFYSPERIVVKLPKVDGCKDWNDVLRVRPEHIKETFGGATEIL